MEHVCAQALHFCSSEFRNLEILTSRRRAPGNDINLFNQISKSFDLKFLWIKKHGTELLIILPTFLFSSEGTSNTPQHSDSHPCIRPRWSHSLHWPPAEISYLMMMIYMYIYRGEPYAQPPLSKTFAF